MHSYDQLGVDYRTRRIPDTRITARLRHALNGCRSVLNIGAGAGSYENAAARLIAVEPSATMIAQRALEAAPCVRAVAEALPFATGTFDAAMGVLTLHHWADLHAGLREARRVAKQRNVWFTWDPQFADDQFWLTRDYLPEIAALDRARYPEISELSPTNVEAIAVPANCTDGFRGAYWKRPEAYLDPGVRQSISAFSTLHPALVERFVQLLADDLRSGEWARRNAALAGLDNFDAGYRLVTSSW